MDSDPRPDAVDGAARDAQPSWFERPGSFRKLMVALALCCAVLIGIDFVYHKHGHFDFEAFPLFFALYGFGAFVVVVFVGAMLRFVISRSEDYYEASDEPESAEPEDHLRG